MDFEDEEEGGGAGWLATFADLMSLLMCFFVLLLSFSELDLAKYKQVAGSMKDAFGVQNQVRAKDIPKGTSIIAQEFSPGRPETTLINVVRQQTIQANLDTLDVRDRVEGESLQKNDQGYHIEREEIEEEEKKEIDVLEQAIERIAVTNQELLEQTKFDAEKLIEALEDEIDAGVVDIETNGRTITIRIRERGSFPSGSAAIQPGFRPVIAKIRKVIQDVEGKISVEGHTDNIPISNPLYPSNWSLSATRALSVVEEMVRFKDIDQSRFVVQGFADTEPLEPNDSAANRSKNRRVEIVIRQQEDDENDASDKSTDDASLSDLANTVEVSVEG